jgi:2-oxoglutarate dehydrogenase E1 component
VSYFVVEKSTMIYWRAQKANQKGDVALVRVEQLYPTPVAQMEAVATSAIKMLDDAVWVQEEPENMGAWPYLVT